MDRRCGTWWSLPIFALFLTGLFSIAGANLVKPLPGKIHPRLAERLGKSELPVKAWVFFDDRGTAPPAPVTERARLRRARNGYVPSIGDTRLDPRRIAAVEEAGGAVRSRSKWLRGVSVLAGRDAIERIAELPFVIRIQEVARLGAPPAPVVRPERPGSRGPAKATDIDYGLSFYQLDQINAIPLLEEGYSGDGIHILMLDSGFYTGAPAFASLQIENRWDFVAGDGIVSNETSEETLAGSENHGTSTLSVIGGYHPGEIVGAAYGSVYHLARTEDVEDEYEGEEDFWVAAIEWGESLGVNLASSSVGYIDWYTYEDMDGATAPITLAADAAAERGVAVVNSQGNEANIPAWDPWVYMIAPADGKKVISVGAVTINGDRAPFSSYGPTYDGRIKPDVSAMGHGVAGVVRPRQSDPDQAYGESLSGTSFSCPLLAGACALLLEIHPILTPDLLAEALRTTASQSGAPDTSIGWGIADIRAAALRPVVIHDQATDLSFDGTGYEVDLDLSLYPGFDAPEAVFGTSGAWTDTVDLAQEGPNAWSFRIPTESEDPRRYYFRFTRNDSVWTMPDGAPSNSYEAGDATAPAIAHTPIGRFPVQEWPALLTVTVTDNADVNDDSVYVLYEIDDAPAGTGKTESRFFLSRSDDSTFTGSFPGSADAGAAVHYRFVAVDRSGNRTESGGYRIDLYSLGYALHYGIDGADGATNPYIGGSGEIYPVFFDLPEAEDVRIRVYDTAGRLTREIWDAPRPPGAAQRIEWDGKDKSGRRVRSGVYFLRFEAGPFTATRKIVVLR